MVSSLPELTAVEVVGSSTEPVTDPLLDTGRADDRPTDQGERTAIAVRPKPPLRRLHNRYLLGEVLGHGSLGTTYRAFDELTKRSVAIKLVSGRYADDEPFAVRFMEATEAAAKLDHPHIVKIVDRGIVDGRPFAVMEHVEGRGLRAVLAEHGKLPIEQCTRIAVQIADALGYAHRRYVAHGDLRPENVLLDTRGDVKLVDFGLVRAAVVTDRTLLGDALRRIAYIPPEQLGQAVPDDRTDVYGLGALLYELLTGAPPTTGKHALLGGRQPQRPQAPRRLRPEVPWRLDRAVMSALSPDPNDGFLSIQELRTALVGRPSTTGGRLPAGLAQWRRKVSRVGGEAVAGRPTARSGYVAPWLAMFLAVALATAALFALLARGSGATNAPNAADRVPAEVTTVAPEVGAAGATRPGSEVMTAVHEAVGPKPAEAEVGPSEAGPSVVGPSEAAQP